MYLQKDLEPFRRRARRLVETCWKWRPPSVPAAPRGPAVSSCVEASGSPRTRALSFHQARKLGQYVEGSPLSPISLQALPHASPTARRGNWANMWQNGPLSMGRYFELMTSETDSTLHGDDPTRGLKGSLSQATGCDSRTLDFAHA